MDIHQVKKLLHRYRTGEVTPSEQELVESWYAQLVDTGEWEWGEGEKEQLQQTMETSLINKVQGTAPIRKINTKWKTNWWVAASVLIFLGLATYFFAFQKPKPIPHVPVARVTHDVAAPQSSKAVVTLANGKKVVLDTISNGSLMLENNMKIMKLGDGSIAYQITGAPGAVLQYNTLENPKGSKVISMVLSDGSKVWLNAGSSLRYPVSFLGAERKVSISGEAYFEVAHNKSKQFVVNKGTVEIVVLGTHFNVNTFEDDDNNIKVTLLEGAVRVTNGTKKGSLKPGQQALVRETVKVVNDVNLEMVMAWKNGYFQFENASLQSVLKQISRWYDVAIIYEGKNRERRFVGELERVLSLSEVLKILEMNGVSFEIIGKELVIRPD